MREIQYGRKLCCLQCNNLTKGTCLKCESFICNRRVECSAAISEKYLGWETGSCVAMWEECDCKKTYASSLKNLTGEMAAVDDRLDEDNIDSFAVHCVLRSFHGYREMWTPEINQALLVKQKKSSMYYPYPLVYIRKFGERLKIHR